MNDTQFFFLVMGPPLTILALIFWGPTLTQWSSKLLAVRDCMVFYKERKKVWEDHLADAKDRELQRIKIENGNR